VRKIRNTAFKNFIHGIFKKKGTWEARAGGS
jgi:hypothetical protein